jgi:hypothetical protein
VRLTRAGVVCYGGVWPNFIPQGQGGGTLGTVLLAGDRPYRPGAAPRPYFVHWDNGAENSYRVEDLVLEGDPEMPSVMERRSDIEELGNIVPFRRMPKG